MAAFSLDEICMATGGALLKKGAIQFTGVSTDTRTIHAGNLFVAITGEHFDGHDFIDQALQQGAAGIVVGPQAVNLDETITVVRVENTLQAYQHIAAYHRSKFNIPVIAITGSNGKTTTKDFTAAVLSSRFSILKTQGNFNNEIGLPLTLLHLNASHDAAVVEMGMRGLGEIRELAEIAKPNIAIVTNVGETHMELLGSIENIAVAKSELVEAVPRDGIIVLNADNDYVRNMAQKSLGKVVLFGIEHEQCQIRAKNIQLHQTETSFDCEYLQGQFTAVIPAIGKHNVYNALAAIAVALELGLQPEEINTGLRMFSPSAMRLSVTRMNDYNIINDAYNASPMSMAAAIDTLSEFTQGRRIAILGDMLELGDVAVVAHQQVGRKLAQSGIEIVITVGKLAQYIAEAAKQGGVEKVIACDSHDHAKENLKQILKPGDTLLVKGSRGMKMETILNELM